MTQAELGSRIKQCRKLQNLTQEKLAELVDLSPHYIYEIERGLKSMSLSTLMDIAMTLHVSTDYLLFGTQTPAHSSDQEPPADKLNLILKNLTPQKRNTIADILSVLIHYL